MRIAQELFASADQYEHHLLEASWVSRGLNAIDKYLVKLLPQAEDYNVRAAAARLLHYTGHQLPQLKVGTWHSTPNDMMGGDRDHCFLPQTRLRSLFMLPMLNNGLKKG